MHAKKVKPKRPSLAGKRRDKDTPRGWLVHVRPFRARSIPRGSRRGGEPRSHRTIGALRPDQRDRSLGTDSPGVKRVIDVKGVKFQNGT
jgi:hypothetical protein